MTLLLLNLAVFALLMYRHWQVTRYEDRLDDMAVWWKNRTTQTARMAGLDVDTLRSLHNHPSMRAKKGPRR